MCFSGGGSGGGANPPTLANIAKGKGFVSSGANAPTLANIAKKQDSQPTGQPVLRSTTGQEQLGA
jgi:hypothetical protein